jgi:hypothetical protein
MMTDRSHRIVGEEDRAQDMPTSRHQIDFCDSETTAWCDVSESVRSTRQSTRWNVCTDIELSRRTSDRKKEIWVAAARKKNHSERFARQRLNACLRMIGQTLKKGPD